MFNDVKFIYKFEDILLEGIKIHIQNCSITATLLDEEVLFFLNKALKQKGGHYYG